MERRFVYPGSVENHYPSSGAVFHATNLDDQSLPYRELRATDKGFRPREVTQLYSAPPQGRNAVPWWTNMGLERRPLDSTDIVPYHSKEVLRNDKFDEKLGKFYDYNGLVDDSGIPAKKTGRVVKKSNEQQLWRKVSDPKKAILTEVNDKLVWRPATDEYDNPRTTMVRETRPEPLPASRFVNRTPYVVY